jgi:hypothetical protein
MRGIIAERSDKGITNTNTNSNSEGQVGKYIAVYTLSIIGAAMGLLANQPKPFED